MAGIRLGLVALGAGVWVAACGGANAGDFFSGAATDGGTTDSASTAEQDADPSQDAAGSKTDGASGRDTGVNDANVTVKDSSVADVSPPDTGPPDPGIFCGLDVTSARHYCNVGTQRCCVDPDAVDTFVCKPKSGTCAGLSVPCSDRNDCPGKLCCATYSNTSGKYQSVSCQETCELDTGLFSEYRLCDPEAAVDECVDIGKQCQPSTAVEGWYICTN